MESVFFINVEDVFNYVSRIKLVQQIKELKINNDLIGWTQSFFINRKVKIIINGYVNLEKDVKTKIP